MVLFAVRAKSVVWFWSYFNWSHLWICIYISKVFSEILESWNVVSWTIYFHGLFFVSFIVFIITKYEIDDWKIRPKPLFDNNLPFFFLAESCLSNCMQKLKEILLQIETDARKKNTGPEISFQRKIHNFYPIFVKLGENNQL